MKKKIIFISAVIVLACIVLVKIWPRSKIVVDTTMFKSGDIIFQTSKSGQSKAVQLATKSEYSHMGIIYLKSDELFVYEAVQPVKLTLLKEWINRGENCNYVIKRLKNAETVLTDTALANMLKACEKYLGKDYDLYFE